MKTVVLRLCTIVVWVDETRQGETVKHLLCCVVGEESPTKLLVLHLLLGGSNQHYWNSMLAFFEGVVLGREPPARLLILHCCSWQQK